MGAGAESRDGEEVVVDIGRLYNTGTMPTRTARSRSRHPVALLLLSGLVALASGCPKARDPEKSDTRLELAKDFLRKGQLEAAEQEGRKALGFDGKNANAYNLLGLVDFVRALNNFRDREVDQCLTGVDRDATLVDFERYLKNADELFKKAIKIDSEYGEAYANRGAVAIQLEEYDRAVDLFEKALGFPARLTNAALTRSNLGWAQFHRGDLVAAAKELRQSLQFQPGMCVSTYRLGRVYFARKEWQKALEEFQAVTANAACPLQEAHLYLVMTYQAMGTPASQQTAERCAALAPKSCIAARCRSLVP